MSDSDSDEHSCIIGNYFENINVSESEEMEDEYGGETTGKETLEEEDKENQQPGDSAGPSGGPSTIGVSSGVSVQQLDSSDDSDGNELWLSTWTGPSCSSFASRPERHKATRNVNGASFSEELTGSRRAYTRHDQRVMVQYLIEGDKIEFAHKKETWRLLSQTDSLETRRTEDSLKKHFCTKLIHDYSSYTTDVTALRKFRALAKQLDWNAIFSSKSTIHSKRRRL